MDSPGGLLLYVPSGSPLNTEPAGVESAITQPIVIPRSEHGISDTDISGGALKVLETLTDAGHSAYLVGGGVRDLLLGLKPKDFDIATGATPEAVRGLFRSSRLIGRRFRLAHVRMGREVIEVATFRAGFDESAGDPDHVRVDGRIVRDNVYGTLEEDAWRRDFTVNCLYYDHRERTVIDFTGGYADARERKLRLIGSANERYREDPVRMLRAVRFAGKLGFDIESDTSRTIYELAPLVEDMPPARLYEEVVKLFMTGAGAREPTSCCDATACSGTSSPRPKRASRRSPTASASPVSWPARRWRAPIAASGRESPSPPAFCSRRCCGSPCGQDAEACTARGMSAIQAHGAAGADVIERQIQHVSLPRRFSLMVREIWGLQPRLVNRRGRGAASRLLAHPRFRAAYDFLLLRAESGEDVADHAKWWTRFQEVDDGERRSMLDDRRGAQTAPAAPGAAAVRHARSRPGNLRCDLTASRGGACFGTVSRRPVSRGGSDWRSAVRHHARRWTMARVGLRCAGPARRAGDDTTPVPSRGMRCAGHFGRIGSGEMMAASDLPLHRGRRADRGGEDHACETACRRVSTAKRSSRRRQENPFLPAVLRESPDECAPDPALRSCSSACAS